MTLVCVLITKHKYNDQRLGSSWVAMVPRRNLASCSDVEVTKIIAKYAALNVEN